MGNRNFLPLFLLIATPLMLLSVSSIRIVNAADSDSVAAKPPTRTPTPPQATPSPTAGGPAGGIANIIPMPVSVTSTGGTFTLPSTADIYVEAGTAETLGIGQ